MKVRSTLRVVNTVGSTWFVRPRTPGRLVLAVTRRCNLRCSMCHTYDLEPGEELSAEEIGTLCGSIPNLTWLDVTGGEVFLRKDIEAVFRAILTNSPRLAVLHFPTNGWFCERVLAVLKLIGELRPDLDVLVTVSLDGPESLHDQIRGQKGSFQRALDTFQQIRRLPGVEAYIGTTVSRTNEYAMDAMEVELRRHIPDFDPRLWHKNWLQISQHFFGNQADEDKHPLDGAALAASHRASRGVPKSAVDLMEWAFLVNLESYLKGAKLGFSCQALHGSCFVSADGFLYPCHVYDRPLGNVRDWDLDLAGLWSSAEVISARRDVKELACGGCFTPCEAYPAIAGSPVKAGLRTLQRAITSVARGALS